MNSKPVSHYHRQHLAVLLIAVLLLSSSPSLYSKKNRGDRISAKLRPALELRLAKKKLTWGAPVYIRIFKESHELELWMRGDNVKGEYVLFRNYKICYWSGELGPKLKEGDHQSPEGCYLVSASQMNPLSRYHLSFNLGYPNAYDRSHQRTGSFLMVHGNCVSVGCYAMGDANIEEIYSLAGAALHQGQKNFAVHCFPFRMTQAQMIRAHIKNSPWLPFWRELRQVYRTFERTWIPPVVTNYKGHYQVKDQHK